MSVLEHFVGRVRQLEDGINDVLAQKGDDLCWMDIYTKLGALVGIDFKPEMLPRETMLENCKRFVDSLLTGTDYKPTDPGLIVGRIDQALRIVAGELIDALFAELKRQVRAGTITPITIQGGVTDEDDGSSFTITIEAEPKYTQLPAASRN